METERKEKDNKVDNKEGRKKKGVNDYWMGNIEDPVMIWQ